MAADPNAIPKLEAAYAILQRAGWPLPCGDLELFEVEVDLAEEEAYLAGLVTWAIRGSPLPVSEVVLDGSIDLRIRQAVARTRADAARKRALLAYRGKIRAIAALLGEVTGAPVRDSQGQRHPSG